MKHPSFFISATNFNLLGIDECVGISSTSITLIAMTGRHPNVMVPTEQAHPELESIEDINAYLLEHKDVID